MIPRLLPAVALAALAAYAAPPVRVLIITGQSDLPYHHWEQTTASLRSMLEATGRFDVRVIEEPRALTAEALAPYDAAILNYNGPRLPAAAETAVEQFVRNGKGFVAFHLCSYGVNFGMEWRDGKWNDGPPGSGWLSFPEIAGMRWEASKIGHARRWAFQVDWKQPAHPVAAGLPPSFTANDELYHRFALLPGSTVIADAYSPKEIGGTGGREPIVWTRSFGQGRVFYTTMGHDPMALYQPGVINAITRGVEWAATGSVTLPVFDPHHTRMDEPVRLLVATGGHGYPEAFYSMLHSLPGVTWKHAASQAEAFSKPIAGKYDVVLLHDMHETTTPQVREHLKAFVESGGGVVSLHHSIVDFTDWPWWYEQVIGGKYFTKAQDGRPASSYQEDLDFVVTPVRGKESHPVLAGIGGPLTVNDELYKGMKHWPGIDVLMETAHPGNDRPVVYTGPHPKTRTVYIQLGHSAHTMNNPGFRRLVSNAVQWTATREISK